MQTMTWRPALAGLAAACLLAACGGGDTDGDSTTADAAMAATTAVATADGEGGTVYVPQAANTTRPDASAQGFARYIVQFKDDEADPAGTARGLAAAHGGNVIHTYSRALKGFAVVLPDAAADAFVRAMENNPHVDHVEVDQVATRSATQGSPDWGLDRVDQRDLPLNGAYNYAATGAGVRAYIVDSGIRATHADIAGRVLPGYTSISDGYGTNDCHGHGTHVAATVGGATWGMAKGVSLVPVRVLGCDGSGYISGIIAGIDWMVANAVKPAVANMSIGASASSSFDTSVNNAVASGITIAVAAGNNGADACSYSPARATAAITVGATTSTDARASYSNYGACLDIFAPGSSITSAGIASDTATQVMSGTSMATPHVAGAAALYLQNNPAATPAQVTSALTSAATLNKVLSAGSGSVNALLYAALDTATVVQPAPAPAPTPVVTTTPISVGWMSTSRTRLTTTTWRASVTIAAKNTSGAAVPGVLVTGNFTYGGTGVSCTTGASGTCTLASGSISASATTFAVTNLSGTNMSYVPSSNAITQVTIYRP